MALAQIIEQAASTFSRPSSKRQNPPNVLFPSHSCTTKNLYKPLPRALKEESYNKHLKARHRNHHQTLQDAEVEDAALSAPHGGEIAVLPRAEVLLVAVDGAQLARELEDGLFEHGGLFGGGALLGWELGAGFVLDLCSLIR